MADQLLDDAMLEVYLFEVSQLLEQLEASILECEESNAYPPDTINDIFRIMHTIKGSSSMMSFHNIATLAHILEDLFALLRQEKLVLPDYAPLSDLMLEGVDFIKVEVEKIRNGDPADGDSAATKERAKAMLQELQAMCGGVPEGQEKASAQAAQKAVQTEKAHSFTAAIHLEDCGGMENVRAFQIIQQLKEHVPELTYAPADLAENFETAESIRLNGFQLFLDTEMSFEEIEQELRCASYVREFQLEGKQVDPPAVPAEGAQGEVPKAAPKEKGKAPAHQSNFISVNVTKLDELMDLVGELVIAEAMVTQNPELNGLELELFSKAARHLRKITNEMQDKVMSIRMVPLTNTFQKMNRIVRDMSKKLEKDVQLQLVGEDTEVDKNIIEHISDPLMHIVRNSLDHGIEPISERLAAGKPAHGTLTLEAKNAGNEVFIFVRDDGRGLNKEKLLKRAQENGLLHKSESEMSDREIYNLIFLPGFSTKEQITEFSGRGVGMDVVTKNIGIVGGTVTVDSEAGNGTTITIRIPLTLAIIDGMNVRVGQSRYTLPTTAIKESFRPAKQDIIRDPAGNEMIMVRGQCYPILRLHQRYGIQADVTNVEEGILIMAEQDDKHVCIFADELLGQQQVVVKALPAYIKKISSVEGITGCTLLGDGSISLILDVSGLIA
ncbi:chemotaxis protein CheA [Ectobacillus ponti]|uniref:Chemotaxis protein CheA n=1 Tax=Ectobacillus ponti TaxID=2961894 RepID=A0AA42BPW5_9BACI|nr:chemotaxis protein CheA [Ectobacillus ponti]MCP8969207.1 chemotaxis protein CheA [Ectobacillus ponti]